MAKESIVEIFAIEYDRNGVPGRSFAPLGTGRTDQEAESDAIKKFVEIAKEGLPYRFSSRIREVDIVEILAEDLGVAVVRRELVEAAGVT